MLGSLGGEQSAGEPQLAVCARLPMMDDGEQLPTEVLAWMHEASLQLDLQSPHRAQLPHSHDPLNLLKV